MKGKRSFYRKMAQKYSRGGVEKKQSLFGSAIQSQEGNKADRCWPCENITKSAFPGTGQHSATQRQDQVCAVRLLLYTTDQLIFLKKKLDLRETFTKAQIG